nr:condensation domain-containing protein [uncultured bacterium]
MTGAVQSIQPPAPLEIPKVDLRASFATREARRLASARRRCALRPRPGTSACAGLVRFEDHDHVALFSFHHIVFDGWSIGIFARELSALYGARIAGRPSPLPPLAIQYADFAARQRQWLRDEVLDLQLAGGVSGWRNPRACPPHRPAASRLPQTAAGQRARPLARFDRKLGARPRAAPRSFTPHSGHCSTAPPLRTTLPSARLSPTATAARSSL